MNRATNSVPRGATMPQQETREASETARVLERIHAEARQASDEPRFVRTMPADGQIRQGDVYLYAAMAPDARGIRELPSLQLAPGDSPGARHIVEGDATAYRCDTRFGILKGPLLHVRQRAILRHPEHSDISLPAGWYGVEFQREFREDRSHPSGLSDQVWRVLD